MIEKERVTKSERMGKAETERKIIESGKVRMKEIDCERNVIESGR